MVSNTNQVLRFDRPSISENTTRELLIFCQPDLRPCLQAIVDDINNQRSSRTSILGIPMDVYNHFIKKKGYTVKFGTWQYRVYYIIITEKNWCHKIIHGCAKTPEITPLLSWYFSAPDIADRLRHSVGPCMSLHAGCKCTMEG